MLEYEIKAKELADSIISSEQYQNYRNMLEKVKQDEFLLVRLNDYRRRTFEVQCGGRNNAKPHMEQLYHEFQDVFDNPDAKKFLDAEMTLCRMIQQVTAAISDNLQLELDFL